MTTPSGTGTSASPTPAPGGNAPASVGTIEADAVTALQVGLGTAHAAVWAYGLISAYDTDDAALIEANRLANSQIRDTCDDILRAAGQVPIRTEVAYQVPVVPTDKPTAQQLGVEVERDACNAWRVVIGSTDNSQLRRFALTALSGAAVRLSQWRTVAGINPRTVPFPGNEG